MLLSYLIQQLESEQSSGEKEFPPGFFPAYRSYPYLNIQRADDNLFCTALTVAKIRYYLAQLSTNHRTSLDAIVANAQRSSHAYRVQRGGTWVYQFWREGRNNHFPNGHILHRFRKFKSPPDADDTALAYLAFPHTQEEAQSWKFYLQTFANGQSQWNKKFSKSLQIPKVYSTWMGTGAMPVEFDVVVMSNVLRCFYAYKLPFDDFDAATVEYITKVVNGGHYIRAPFQSAPWYPSPILIYFHLATLAAEVDWPALEPMRSTLRQQLEALRPLAKTFMERILLHIASYRLNLALASVQFPTDWQQQLDLTCYIGGMFTALRSKWSWQLASSPLVHWRFQCRAYALAILLEYHCLQSGVDLPIGRKTT